MTGTRVKAVEDGLLRVGNWAKTLELTVPPNTTVKAYVYAKVGQLIVIEPAVLNTLSFTIYYADGSTDRGTNNTLNSSKLRFRPQKDVEHIRFYNGSATTERGVSIGIEDAPVHTTNYYNKDDKISGYIKNNGAIESGGYYHAFVPVALGDKVYISGYPSTFGSTVYGFLYDESMNFLARISMTAGENGLYYRTLALSLIGTTLKNAQENVAFIGFNMSVAGSDKAVCYINNVPETVIGYGQYEPESHVFFNAQQKDYIGSSGNSPISGKKIAYNGDSIAESRLSTGNSNNGGSYPKIIADLTGGTYDNRAHGGGILASEVGDGGDAAARYVVSDVTNMPDDADLICFEGGINDYWRKVPLGDYSESDYTGTLDTTTICGALESIFRQAKEKWVGKPICFVITHKIKSTVYVANSRGYTWMQVHDKMVGICKKYSIPYYDAFENSGLNAYDNVQNTNFLTSNSSGTADGCHPNENGYKIYYVPQLIALFNSIMPRG